MDKYCDWGREALDAEIEALRIVRGRLGAPFAAAVRAVKACKGKVVVTGLGKSGHIGKKIAATLASLGAPAFFMHSAEALHGDSGMMGAGDILIAISYSGETREVAAVAAMSRNRGLKIISMTKSRETALAKMSDICLETGVPKEADPLGLAPTASSTVTLALGDALAVAVSRAKNFKAADFAVRHPHGSLGKLAKKIKKK